MHRIYQGANRDCSVCGRRLLGEFSGRDITWGNATYRVREFLGGGGMGEVYRSIEHDHANTFSRECAIKFNKNMMDPDVVKRFQLEVRILNMLQNPHNIRVYNYGELYEERASGMDVRAQFMVMELLEGQPLNEITKQGPMSPREAVPIFVQVCSALSEAHQRDIIHRDLKPHNIMLQNVVGDRFAKVFDFGLSKLTNNMDDRLSTTGVVMGTFRYMSPEQALGEDVDRRTDIFSLGVVLYEVLEGQHPFPAKNLFELFTLHQQGPPPMERIPVELQAIVLKSLAYEQGKRYQSVEELRGDLQLWLGDSMSGGSIYTSQIIALREMLADREAQQQAISGGVSRSASSTSESKPGLWLTLFSLLVVAIGVGGFFIFRSNPLPNSNSSDATGQGSTRLSNSNAPLHPNVNPNVRADVRKQAIVERRGVERMVPVIRPQQRVESRTMSRRPVVRRSSVPRRRRYQPRRYRRRVVVQRKAPIRRQDDTPVYRPPVVERREPPPPRRPVRVAMLRREPPPPIRRAVQLPQVPTCPTMSPPVRYGQLDQALGRRLNTPVSRYINRAAKETIYDAGLRLSQSWKKSPVICKRNHLRERMLSIVQGFCSRYRPNAACRGYQAHLLTQGDRVIFVCKRRNP